MKLTFQPDLVSSHRRFVSKCEVTELSNNLSGRDDPLMLFLFTDYMEICKIKKHRFNSAKSPTYATTGLNTARVSHQKSYKHIKLLPLSSIAVVYDIQDSPRAFALPHKDKMYSFSICDDIEKIIYLKSLCKQLAENACRADAVSFG
jgi:protein ECT2